MNCKRITYRTQLYKYSVMKYITCTSKLYTVPTTYLTVIPRSHIMKDLTVSSITCNIKDLTVIPSNIQCELFKSLKYIIQDQDRSFQIYRLAVHNYIPKTDELLE